MENLYEVSCNARMADDDDDTEPLGNLVLNVVARDGACAAAAAIKYWMDEEFPVYDDDGNETGETERPEGVDVETIKRLNSVDIICQS